MDEEPDKSKVEVVMGPNQVRLEGSEEFVANELEKILEEIDIADYSVRSAVPSHSESQNTTVEDSAQQSRSNAPPNPKDSPPQSKENADPLDKVGERIQVDSKKLEQHFYVDETEDGYEVHIWDPTQIPDRAALLGYCTIKEVLTGTTYHDNQETKKRLINDEKVDINGWGRQFLHNLRNDGLIKDDPHTDKKRNKPFQITPKGREQFLSWVRNQ